MELGLYPGSVHAIRSIRNLAGSVRRISCRSLWTEVVVLAGGPWPGSPGLSTPRRENTMFVAFLLEAVGIMALYVYGQTPLGFVLLSEVVFFAWGEIYSLFPTTCTDCFGVKYATTNAGLLYTAKGTASLLVPLANLSVVATGGGKSAFIVASLLNAVAAVMAIFALKPIRWKMLTERQLKPAASTRRAA